MESQQQSQQRDRSFLLTQEAGGRPTGSHLVIDVDAILAVEVRLVAVLVPPAPSIRHGTAGDKGRRVAVLGGEEAATVVSEGIA